MSQTVTKLTGWVPVMPNFVLFIKVGFFKVRFLKLKLHRKIYFQRKHYFLLKLSFQSFETWVLIDANLYRTRFMIFANYTESEVSFPRRKSDFEEAGYFIVFLRPARSQKCYIWEKKYDSSETRTQDLHICNQRCQFGTESCRTVIKNKFLEIDILPTSSAHWRHQVSHRSTILSLSD